MTGRLALKSRTHTPVGQTQVAGLCSTESTSHKSDSNTAQEPCVTGLVEGMAALVEQPATRLRATERREEPMPNMRRLNRPPDRRPCGRRLREGRVDGTDARVADWRAPRSMSSPCGTDGYAG